MLKVLLAIDRLTSQFTVLMYCLVFAAAIKLRYSHRNAPRPYQIPGQRYGIWLVGLVGIGICLLGFLLGLYPPKTIGITHVSHYVLLVLVGDVVILGVPLLFIQTSKKFK